MSTIDSMPQSRTFSRWSDEGPVLSQFVRRNVPEAYFAVLAFVLPISSFLIVPGVQGTIPPYVLGLLSILLCLERRYLSSLLIGFLFWASLLVLSQFSLIASGTRVHLGLPLVEPADFTPAMRTTLMSQSLYLLACYMIYLFARSHYQPRLMKYLFWGAWFVVLYGLWEWCLQTFAGTSVDFLANRTFGESSGQSRAASWAQFYNVGPLRILRFKSTATEPSRYATIAVVYLSLAVAHNRRRLSLALVITLMLTVSLTGLLAFAVMVLTFLVLRRTDVQGRVVLVALSLLMLGIVTAWMIFPEVIQDTLIARIQGDHRSTQIRLNRLTEPLPVFWRLPLANQLFGVGAGTCFLPGAMRILINFGIVGFFGFASLFLFPLVRLRHAPQEAGLFTAVMVLLFVYSFISVGIFLPLAWMILGMARARSEVSVVVESR
jgi:hypothetical protein